MTNYIYEDITVRSMTCRKNSFGAFANSKWASKFEDKLNKT